MEKKKLSPQVALQKIQHYCAYQERSHKQVRDKLYLMGLWKSEVEEIMSQLITDGFLNEQRFASAYAGGKFRIKKWGRLKIVRELEAQGITNNCIKSGLKEIDERNYQAVLRGLIAKKNAEVKADNPYARRNKVARYAIAKGYEPDLVWGIIKETLKTQDS